MKNKILIVIDMQNDFIDGALGTKEAVEIVPYVKEKIKEYKDNNYPVIFTKDTHFDTYLSTLEGKNLPVPHCIINTPGWRIREELDPDDKTYVIDKYTFGFIEFEKWLIDRNIIIDGDTEIELCGLCTDICVISNALILRAYYPNTKIIVDSKATAGVTPETKEAALTTMKMCQITVI